MPSVDAHVGRRDVIVPLSQKRQPKVVTIISTTDTIVEVENFATVPFIDSEVIRARPKEPECIVPKGTAFTNKDWLHVAILCMAILAHAISTTVIFPFASFMIVDMKMVDDIDEAGEYAGYVAAAFMLGRIPSSIFWGYIADKWGRKPVLVMALITIAVCSLLFGFGTSCAMALAVRFALGLGNGLVGTAKTCVADFLDKDQQARGMAYLVGAFTVGSVIGPALGGLLARPTTQYPNLFSQDNTTHDAFCESSSCVVWARFPYLLPMLPSAILAAACIPVLWLALPETVPDPPTLCCKRAALRRAASVGMAVEMTDLSNLSSPLSAGQLMVQDGQPVAVDAQKMADDGQQMADNDRPMAEDGQAMADDGRAISDKGHDAELTDPDASEGDASADAGGLSWCVRCWRSVRRTLGNTTIMATGGLYCLLSFLSMLFDEVLNLWCVASVAVGGLGMSEHELGLYLCITGALLALYQFLVYPALARRVSLRALFRYAALSCAPCFALYPATAMGLAALGRDTYARWLGFWAVILTLGVVRLALILTCFTSAVVMLNNAVPTLSRGRLNGMLVSVVSAFKAVGPAAGSVLFAWSVSGHETAHGRTPPPGSNYTEYIPATALASNASASVGGADAVAMHVRSGVAFYLCAVLSLVMFAMSYKLPVDADGDVEPRSRSPSALENPRMSSIESV